MGGRVGRSDVAWDRDYGGTFLSDGGDNRGIDNCASLLRVHKTSNVQGRGVEELVGVELFDRGGVHEAGLDVAGDGYDRSSLFAGIHEPVEKMNDAGAGSSTYGN